MKKTTISFMKLVLLSALILFQSNFSFSQVPGVVRCYSDEMDSIRKVEHPSSETDEQFESWINDVIETAKHSKIVGGVYQIPVVFHVIHSGEAVGTGTNVSQAAIQSQIDVLNEDFRRIFGTNGYNTNPLGADTKIEFCLAQRRPDGSAFAAGQPGVNRILYSTISGTAPPFSTGFIDATIKTWTYNGGVATATRGWVPTKYMNIWLCNISGGILGYAQFPTSPLGGMFDCASGGSNATDGVVFLYNSIGKSSVTGFGGVYNEGRTATHEIGHWLGLRHIWGDGGCTVDDYCNDTPEAAAANYGCPTINSCTNAPDPGNDMVANYMDYTNDLCMNIFTNDQKQRMRAVLEGSPNRVSLINSDACTPPNPSDASITDIFNPKGDNCAGSIIPSVQLRNRGSNALTSATISYSIDNGTATTFSWTGSLAAAGSATVALPAFTATLGTHTIKSWTTLPNGIADPSTTYDTSSVSFVVSNGIMPNYTQNFESETFPPDLRWVVENVNADCRQWTASSAVSAAGAFINNSAMLPCFNNSVPASNENLYTPIFILPCNATAASLTFNVAYRQRSAGTNDRLIVEISQDCGATWTATGYDKQGSVLAVSGTLATSEYYPTAANHWRAETINLLSYVTSTSKNIRFRFRGIANNGNNIFVDDIAYTATTPGEIQLNQAATDVLDGGYYNFPDVSSGGSTTQTFTITNTGTTSLTLTGPITVTGTGFSLGTTFGTTTVAAGATTTFTLTFAPVTGGNFTGNVSFGTNDCDEGTYNFQINGVATVTPPVADFSGTPVLICQGGTVTFTNLSTNATSYSWNFGAGATPPTSTAANPTVVFNTAGTNTITLTATNAFGNDVETKTAYITILSSTATALPLTEGFTAATFPPTGWNIVNGNASATSWVRNATIGNAPTAGNSMLFDNFTFNDSDDDEMRIKPLIFTGFSAAQLTFDVAYAPYDAANYDGLEVLVSTDCGATFTSVYSKSNTVLATAAATTTIFTPTAAQWRTETVSLTPYVGQSNVIVAFKNLSGYGNRLFVDNINITGSITATANFTAAPNPACVGQTVTYTNTSTGASSYSWNFGAGATPATATTAGPHTVTYSTAGTKSVSLQINGTGPTSTQSVVVNALPATPTITPSGSTTFCTGGSVTLSAPASTSYLWSPGGATTQTLNVTASGSYTVTVSNASGCTATSAATVVTVNAAPATPTITPSGATTFCTGGSVTLSAPASTSYLWSPGGATTQTLNVTASGSYTVTVSNASGCTATSAATTVTVNTLPAVPTITPSGATTFCTGGSVTLSAPVSTSYLWSPGGATTQTLNVTTSGSYTVTVSNASGCTATSAATTVTVNTLPAVPTITPSGATTFCAGGSVTLSAPASTSYLWSPGGATTQTLNVTTSGSYTVTVSNAAGCTRTSTVTTVTVNALPATPTVTPSGSTTFCTGGSVTLSAPASTSYLWSPGGATTQTLNVTASGSYTVTVSNASGCTATSAATVVTVNTLPATPTITPSGSTTFCTGGSVILSAPVSTSYLWSPGGATTQTLNVTTSGSYTVTVSNASGCTATSSATVVTVNAAPATPTITPSGATTFCTGGSVTLSAPASTSYLWSPGGATTQTLNVTTSGSYTVTVSNASGCTATSAATTVTVNTLPAVPTITPSGATTFCSGGSVTLSAPVSTSYLWSPGGAITQTLNVTTSGSYTVTVSNASGCTATSSATVVTVNPTPTISLGTVTNPSTCAGTNGSIQITGSGTGNVTWSGSASGTLTSVTLPQTITGLGSGSYSIQFTSAAGCSSNTLSQSLTGPAPPATPAITPGGSTTFCAGGSVTLSAPVSTSYLWSPGGATTQTLSVTASGSYTVTVSNASGCTATSAATVVTVNAAPATPTITPGGATTFCTGGSVDLSAPASTSYLWSPGGATTQTLNVTSSGSYTVTVSNASGCTATSAAAVVTVNTLPATPTITPSGPTTFCAGGSVDLSAPASTTYLWSPGGEITQTVNITSNGSYAVTVSNAAGCTATSAATLVTVNALPATPIITPSGPTTFCAGGSVDLSATAATGYLWSPGGESTQTVNITASGSYSVTVSNASGCTATSLPTVVTVNPIPATPTITAGGPTTFCDESSVSLTSSSATGNTWSTGSTNNSISVNTSGTITLTVTENGCVSAPDSEVITVNTSPVVSLGAFATVCDYNPVFVLTGGSPAGGTYTGNGVSGGSFDPAIAGLGSSSITYTFVDGNGCDGSASSSILVDECLGITESGMQIAFYPNPSTGLITVSGSEKIKNVIIYDKVGRLVYETAVGSESTILIDLSFAAAGVYSVHVITENQQIIENVVIQK
jgi:PKD repeat protein